MQNIAKIKNDAAAFLKNDIWRVQLTNLNKLSRLAVKITRTVLLSIRGFQEDKLPLRASALTFYSLLSLVPVLAMIFGIAKGFGFQNILERRLMEAFADHEVVMQQLMGWAKGLLDATEGGLVAGIGITILLYTVIRLLSLIEKSFNYIWGVQSSRSLGRKFSDYLSVMMIAPLMLIISGGATVFITTQVSLILDKIALLGFFSPLILFLLKFLPYGILWLLLTMVYILMPNAKVNVSSGFIAGIVAGTLVHLAQWAYITFQIGAAKYNAIYGSFAALPLFLVWLQITWIIVLIGAEISFAYQNVKFFEYEPDEANASVYFKRQIALYITHYVVKRFEQGESPQTAVEISQALQTPVRLARKLCNELVESRILSTVQKDEDKEPAFQPAFDIQQLSIRSVLQALDKKGINQIPFKPTKTFETLSSALDSFDQLIQSSPENKLLVDIA